MSLTRRRLLELSLLATAGAAVGGCDNVGEGWSVYKNPPSLPAGVLEMAQKAILLVNGHANATVVNLPNEGIGALTIGCEADEYEVKNGDEKITVVGSRTGREGIVRLGGEALRELLQAKDALDLTEERDLPPGTPVAIVSWRVHIPGDEERPTVIRAASMRAWVTGSNSEGLTVELPRLPGMEPHTHKERFVWPSPAIVDAEGFVGSATNISAHDEALVLTVPPIWAGDGFTGPSVQAANRQPDQ